MLVAVDQDDNSFWVQLLELLDEAEPGGVGDGDEPGRGLPEQLEHELPVALELGVEDAGPQTAIG
jgi:hypothetical protein